MLFAVGLAGAMAVSGSLSASAAPSAGATACAPVRSSLLDERGNSLGRLATLEQTIDTDKYQLAVARKYGDSDRATDLQAEIDEYQPEYDLRKAQVKEMVGDLKSLRGCKASSVAGVRNRSRARSNELLRLFYLDDLSDQRKAANVANYQLGIAEQYNDKARIAIYDAKLRAARAAIAQDKRRIKAITAVIAELRGKNRK